MKILLTGGGSGGHVSPALAVANRLKLQHPDVELLYIGGTMTMEGATGPSIEQSLVSKTDIPFVAISAGKLKRDGLSLNMLKRLWGVVPGIWQAYQQVRQFGPQVVFSSGGYVSLPVVVAAWLQRVPIVIHEQTSAVGLANKLASKMASKVAITFPQSAIYFQANKVVVTGNPLHRDILQPVDKDQLDGEFAAWLYQKSQLPLLYITGGGLGSHKINLAVEEVLDELLARYRVIHQTGANQQYADYERLQASVAAKDQTLAKNYWLAKHLPSQQIGHVYSQAKVIISRAGANTVLELAYWAAPTIFIPIPWVTHDEQTKNAQILVEVGTASILPEADLSGQTLLQAVQQKQSQQISQQANQQAKALIKLTADQDIANLITSIIK